MTKQNLVAGDRIAYTAKFLKNTGQFTGSGGARGARRGTFVSYDLDNFARVKWDDFSFAYTAHQWGEDYAIDARDNGQTVHATNIAKVGSPRFALNDL